MISKQFSNSLHQKKEQLQHHIHLVAGTPSYFTPPQGTPSGQTFPINNSLESSMKSSAPIQYKEVNTHWDNLIFLINTFFELAQDDYNLKSKLLEKNIDKEQIFRLLQQKKYEIILVILLTVTNEYIRQKKLEETSSVEVLKKINASISLPVLSPPDFVKFVSKDIEINFNTFREKIKNVFIPDKDIVSQIVYRTSNSPTLIKSNQMDDFYLCQQRKDTAQFQSSQQMSPRLEREIKLNPFRFMKNYENDPIIQKITTLIHRTHSNSNSPQKKHSSPRKQSEQLQKKGLSQTQNEFPLTRSTKSLSKISQPINIPKYKKYKQDEVHKDYLSIDHIRKKKKVENCKSYNIITNENSENEEKIYLVKKHSNLTKFFEKPEEQKIDSKKDDN